MVWIWGKILGGNLKNENYIFVFIQRTRDFLIIIENVQKRFHKSETEEKNLQGLCTGYRFGALHDLQKEAQTPQVRVRYLRRGG